MLNGTRIRTEKENGTRGAVSGRCENLLTREESAVFLGVSLSTFAKMASREDFPRRRVLAPRVSYYLRDELVAWIDRAGGNP